MECNKDEAVRAKEIAERKFGERDYAGAKKFTLKAQNLYPELEGLSHMVMTFDVYLSAERRICGSEVDWYNVLGVNPSADDETVRKHYRKLALALHPDKNKSVGADGAFKLVSEAWSLLSDKEKRSAYNKKINPMGFQQRVPTQTEIPSAPPTANGFHSNNSAPTSDSRAQNKNNFAGPSSVPSASSQKPATFWTICNRCKTQYEYLRIYLNHTLLCPNCHEAFLALEKAPPPNIMKSSNCSLHKHQNSRHNATNSHRTSAARNWGVGHSSGPAGITTNGADQLYKKRKFDEINGSGADMLNQMAMGNGVAGFGSASERGSGYGFSGINHKPYIWRELSAVDTRNILTKKARLSISRKLEEWCSKHMKLKENDKQKNVAANDKSNNKKYEASANKNTENKNKKNDASTDCNEEAPVSINVPDSDFHNFDLERTEGSFQEDQVWAAYDEDDGMPRYYARIHKVISLKPFKMKISWLNSRSNSEFGSLDWVGSGFPKTCGDFRTGRHEICETLNYFSHEVNWAKGTRGVIRILPRKGEIWALYRNWSPDWTEHPPVDVVHKYDMVEVLNDYIDEEGLSVIHLAKVTGFKTVFQKHMDNSEARKIPKEEMFRFSHQVPYHLLTGEEAHNAPKGCWELDPAATPLELLQTVMEANDTSMVELGVKAEEQKEHNFPEVKAELTVENASGAKGG